MKKIAIFASGNGSNAQAIINYFEKNPDRGEISAILSNKSDAFVLERAKKHKIDALSFNAKEFRESPKMVLDFLKTRGVNFVVLAGYMQLIPLELIAEFENRIVNIHPALLPAYGGKGMYGMNVHRAVVENREPQSGITIHYVSQKYDEGAIIFQASVSLSSDETPETLAQKVLELEHKHYPEVIANCEL